MQIDLKKSAVIEVSPYRSPMREVISLPNEFPAIEVASVEAVVRKLLPVSLWRVSQTSVSGICTR